MTTKKKVLIGAGVAAIGLAAIGGTLFVGKKLYDRKNAAKVPGGARALVDDGPESPALAPYHQPHPKTFTDTVNIPDAVILGLSYEVDTGARINLLAAAYDSAGQNLGYIQGGGDLAKLFGGAIVHTGDDQAEDLGDLENIVIDLRNVPANATTILFGAHLLAPPQGAPAKAYIHMLPMIRNEQIEEQASQGGTRSIDFDSDEEGDPEQFPTGSRSLDFDAAEEDDEEDFVRLYTGDIDAQGAQFCQQRAYVGGKIFRDAYTGSWKFTPYRLVVPADPQHGLWPAFDHYAKA
jgi:hypothetical protein